MCVCTMCYRCTFVVFFRTDTVVHQSESVAQRKCSSFMPTVSILAFTDETYSGQEIAVTADVEIMHRSICAYMAVSKQTKYQDEMRRISPRASFQHFLTTCTTVSPKSGTYSSLCQHRELMYSWLEAH